MLKPLPRSDMDIFSCYLHSSLSIRKFSFIIPIHQLEISLGFSASIRAISISSCVSKLFLCTVFCHRLFFQKSNFIFLRHKPGWHKFGFCHGCSTLDQVFDFYHFISYGFNKPKPIPRAILATINYFQAFDFVWRSIRTFFQLTPANLRSCFAE